MQILIPMAGNNSNFVMAGYKTHQTVLPTYNRHTGKKMPMVICAVADIPGINENGDNLYFVDLEMHRDSGIENEIRRYYPAAKFITLKEETDGQAATCLKAKHLLSGQDELLIVSSDSGMLYDLDEFNTVRHNCDTVVFTYTNDESVLENPSAFGWAVEEKDHCVSNVSVKKVISNNPLKDHALAAVFWFKQADIFINSAEKMISDKVTVNGSYYVDDVINYIIKEGYCVKLFDIDRYISWNTPKTYENYQKTYSYWHDFLKNIDTGEIVIPFSIGIAGDSGSGKSTLLNVINKFIKPEDILVLEGDGEHKWERNSEEWKKFTHLDVDANNLYFQANNLQLLKSGLAIKRREYDHSTGTFTEMKRYNPKPYVVMCGLHSFYLPQNRKNLDIMIYMDIDEKLRRFWKIKRDIGERGRNIDEVIYQIENRMDDRELFIEPQKKYADICINYFDLNLNDYTTLNYKEEIWIKIILKKEDIICGLVNKVLCLLKRDIDGINFEQNALIFSEENLKNTEIPVYNILNSLNIDTSEFNISDKQQFYGKEGIVALIIMAYISEIKHG